MDSLLISKRFSMIELTDLQKIGLGLVGFGGLFLTFGVFLFLDKEPVEVS